LFGGGIGGLRAVEDILEMRLETTHYILRPLGVDDATERYLSWIQDPEVTRTLYIHGQNQTIETLRKYIASHDGKNRVLFGIFAKDGRHIGTHSFRYIPEEKRATVGVMIGDKGFWGRAVPLETRARILDYAFDELGCARVEAGCMSTNLPAIYNFKKQCWTIKGVEEGWRVIEGRIIDLVHFFMTREQWHAKQ